MRLPRIHIERPLSQTQQYSYKRFTYCGGDLSKVPRFTAEIEQATCQRCIKAYEREVRHESR
jgi:hypothetical protein